MKLRMRLNLHDYHTYHNDVLNLTKMIEEYHVKDFNNVIDTIESYGVYKERLILLSHKYRVPTHDIKRLIREHHHLNTLGIKVYNYDRIYSNIQDNSHTGF